MQLSIDLDMATKILSPLLVALIGNLAKRYLQDKPRLVTYLVHATAHPLPPAQPPAAANAPQSIHTHTIVVTNTGNKTAHNVRIDHAVFPYSHVVWPPVNHTVTHGPGGGAEICIPVLVPKEQVNISYLYAPPLTWNQVNGWVKCDEGMAKAIHMIPSSPPPRGVRWALWTLVFVGASTVAYWILQLVLPYLLR